MVRAVSAAGIITRGAGTGTAGNTGDDGPATGAELRNPFGVAVTADGGFLFADVGNNEVRGVGADAAAETKSHGRDPVEGRLSGLAVPELPACDGHRPWPGHNQGQT